MPFKTPKLFKAEPQTWLNVVWEALGEYREDCIPEGVETYYDEEWGDICTAMAWITEELGLPTGADADG